MKKFLLSILLFIMPSIALAQTPPVQPDGQSSMVGWEYSTNQYVLIGADASGNLNVNCQAGCSSGGGGTVEQGAQATSATGNTWFVQQTGALPAGSNVIGGVTVTSLPNVTVGSSALPTGASTSALQTTGNTSLSTIATNTTGVATSALQTSGNTSLSTIATNTTRDAVTTDDSGTIAAVSTFQTVFASNTTRKGCLIVNTSANVEFIGINTTPTPSATNSIPLAAGASFTCNSPGVVMDDQISISSATADSTFVAKQQ
jgi:hypothetical protein